MKRLALLVSVAVVVILGSAAPAAAHAGHSHQQRGSSLEVLTQVAVAALGVAALYVVISCWFRFRDRTRT
jgi:hypothetical protein